MKKLFGMLLRPACTTVEKLESKIRLHRAFIEDDFFSNYTALLYSMDIVVYSAKIFLSKHWQEVEDWSKLEVTIRDNSKTKTKYYNHIENEYGELKGDDIITKTLREMHEKEKRNHNPVVTLTDVVLDPTDGDFSLTINGKDHLWIDGESVIVIADYAEKQIELQQNKGEPV